MDSGHSARGGRQTRLDGASAYASFSELIYADQPLADTLAAVSALAQEALSVAWEVSLTVIEGERAWTAVKSGSVAPHLDQQQYDCGSGPSLDAARSSTTIELTMDGSNQPYPHVRKAAQRESVTHMMSVGLSTGDQVKGAMNIYSFTGRPFGDDTDTLVRGFSYCAGIVLAHVERYHSAATRADQIEAALQSRNLIERAKGIIMTRYRCTSDEAFTMLVGLAQQQNVPLRTVALTIVRQVDLADD